MHMMRKQAGFTLIEIMIVVIAIGVLAAIAIPNYTDYVRRSKAQEAMSELSTMRIKMEQWFQDNRTYTGYVNANCARSDGSLVISGRHFTYACAAEAGPPATYSITATGVATEGMSGYIYSINQSNARTSTVPPGAEVNCWVFKRGETC